MTALWNAWYQVVVRFNALILDNPGGKSFLNEKLPALNVFDLHTIKWFVALNAFIRDIPG